MTSIKQQMLSGVFYTAIAKYSGIIISLIVMAVLARLLRPDDFGVMAIATVIINFFNIFTNIGFSSAIIQNKRLTPKDINNIYMFTIWLGIILSILFFFSAWGIASYYRDNQLIHICHLLSISLFFSAVSIVPNTLFYKNKNFKFIAYRTFFIQFSVGILSIIAALLGAGLYTLTIQPILSSALILGVSLKKYPQKIQWTVGIESVKKIWNYSIYQFLFNVVNYFTRNLDKLLIGKYMGMTPLGYYEKSYTGVAPVSNENWTGGVATSVIKSAALDNLAAATKTIIPKYIQEKREVDRSDILAYDFNDDANYDFEKLIRNLTGGVDNTDYRSWYTAFEAAVVYRKTTLKNYSGIIHRMFTMEGSEGLSTYIPTGASNSTMNTFYRTLSWYTAAGWDGTGW